MYGQFFVIFALMLTGYFFKKINIINDEMNRGLNKFIIYFSFPCFIFYKVAGIDMGSGLLKDFIIAFVVSSILFLIFGLYVFGYAKLRRFPREDACAAEPMMIFSNNAFMGFPITYIFFGEIGLVFMIANNIAMNLILFSYGVFVLRRDGGKKGFSLKSLAKCFLNPNILALICGIAFYSLDIGIPEAAGSYLSCVGGICTPMAMICVGAMLVGTNAIEVIKNRLVLESAINKILILPVLSYALLIFAR
jgi:predicted permease